ncbi:hypothetical protein [Streptomonospora sediminis]
MRASTWVFRTAASAALAAGLTACGGADGGESAAGPSASAAPSASSPPPASSPSPPPTSPSAASSSPAANSAADTARDVCGKAVPAVEARQAGDLQLAESGERLALMMVVSSTPIDDELVEIYNENPDQQKAVELIADWCAENGY